MKVKSKKKKVKKIQEIKKLSKAVGMPSRHRPYPGLYYTLRFGRARS